ncbi:SDR family oxidoreductase [Corallococcus macrosporus]|uniref:SDR family oxidoreductase n=1 Tax=Corallococcus macrosporus TaxID=35 RepID=A0ABS3DNN6_9BACT|nr:SDR family oxidoreductase [Corallococcus macrosporus]MBN8232949.1 SDR family oxidoreductase [Corallococcus macrosporus]
MKTWFITGASSGIGRILTEQLLAQGHRVAATLRRTEVLDALKAKHGERLWVARLDVTDAAQVEAVVGRAFTELGRVDVVVSNAGYGVFGAAEETEDAQLRRVLDTNLLGSIHLIRAFIPRLREQGGGHILQVSSEGGQMAYPAFSAYHASKWGIEGYVESVAQEVAPFGIALTLVEPGPTRTNFGDNLVRTRELAVYAPTPVGAVRAALANGSFEINGDADKTARAIIDVAEETPAPRRRTLGSTAYHSVQRALRQRLDELESQREVALSTDCD